MKTIQLIACAMLSMVACKKETPVNDRNNTAFLRPQREQNNPDMKSSLGRKKVTGTHTNTANNPFEKEMFTLDSLFYSRVYNNRDTAMARAIIHKDFEFYHDRIGELSDSDTAVASEIMIQKFHDMGNHYKRRLVPGSLRSYPLYDGKSLYGAIQQGINQYHNAETGKLEGTGHFIHLWVKEENEWKLKRVISYNHEAIIP